MLTYSSLTQVDDHPISLKFKVLGAPPTNQFFYGEPFLNHYRYHHEIDDHNKFRNSPIFIEDTWGTKHWSDCVHSFLVTVAEVNTRKAVNHWQKDGVSIPRLSFCCKLVFELIHHTPDGN